MAGIKDVAKVAKVGVGTVSRVINNNGYVSDETRKKVEKAMSELNYTPNELARNLFRKKSGIIAVLVPTVAHPFFAEFVNYIEIEFHERGYKTMICNTEKEKNYESEYLEMLKQHIVDGVITGVHSLDLQEYLNMNQPIVALDRYIGDDIPVVSVDHKQGGMFAAKELLRCGCKKVVQIQAARKVEAPAQERHEEFERIMTEAGVEVHTYELQWNRFDITYFEEFCEQVFRQYPDADGMFGTDLVSLVYMKIAERNGLKIPDDLKVIAYDGTSITKVAYPSLTTIKQPIDKLAKEAVRLMIHKIDGTNNIDKRVELEVELIRGDSTRKNKEIG